MEKFNDIESQPLTETRPVFTGLTESIPYGNLKTPLNKRRFLGPQEGDDWIWRNEHKQLLRTTRVVFTTLGFVLGMVTMTIINMI